MKNFRMFIHTISRAVAAATLLVAVAGCKSSSGARQGHAGTAKDPWLIGMSQCNLGEPWRVQMNEDIARAAAARPELKLVFKDAQNDALIQRAQVEELVHQGIDLLIISPKETAPLTQPVAEAYRKKIPVIVLDRAVQGNEYTSFIGADNAFIGRKAGEHARKLLPGAAKVVELQGLMTSMPGRDRHTGFRDAIRGSSLHVVFEADMGWLEPNARKEMESALTTHKRIDLVYAHNDPGAHGAFLAAKAIGREREMKFIGIDALPHEGVQYVRRGILDATFLYPTGGKEAIEQARRILSGQTVPKKVVLGTRLFTRENVGRGGDDLR
jgi:ribose transport system substrate-binding protein